MMMMKMMMSLLLTLTAFISCTQVNVEERAHYKNKNNQKIRHGLIPLESHEIKMRMSQPLDQGKLAKGRALYQKHCLECHGETGTGDGPMGRALDMKPKNLVQAVREVPNFKFYLFLSKFNDKMPGWTSALKEDDLTLLEGYIRSLALKE